MKILAWSRKCMGAPCRRQGRAPRRKPRRRSGASSRPAAWRHRRTVNSRAGGQGRDFAAVASPRGAAPARRSDRATCRHAARGEAPAAPAADRRDACPVTPEQTEGRSISIRRGGRSARARAPSGCAQIVVALRAVRRARVYTGIATRPRLFGLRPERCATDQRWLSRARVRRAEGWPHRHVKAGCRTGARIAAISPTRPTRSMRGQPSGRAGRRRRDGERRRGSERDVL